MGVDRLGRYTILKHLASGGMADVLLGRTDGIEGFARHVVVKRIRAEHAKDQRFIQMFLDEARVAANLHHQNIVQVHDIGEANGEYFIAMEYIHGEDLRTVLSAVSKSRTHVPLGYVAAIISSAAAGLHYAHERRGSDKKPLNIVHRDVSPSNIIVGQDGAVKVLDFGIAKAAMRQVETRSGSLKGKVSYMSPEQCKGETTIDRRSDVYSLGVVLYELATTTRLFKGDSDYLMMDAIVNGKVPLPRVKRPDLPNELSSIIMRALAVDPNRRYQTADELRIALDQFAIKASLTASTSALASYMHKLFGEKIEPWLETDTSVETAPIDPEARTEAAGRSWTEMPRDDVDPAAETATGGGTPSSDAKTRTDGKARRRSGAVAALAHADTMPPPFRDSSRESRTSSRLGWENEGQLAAAPPAMKTSTKVLLLGAPVAVALLGIGVWHLASSSSSSAPQVASSTSVPQPVTVPPPPPPPAPAPVSGTATVASAAAPAPAAPAPPIPPAAPAPAIPAAAPAAAAPAAPAVTRAAPTHDATIAHHAAPARKPGAAPKPEPKMMKPDLKSAPPPAPAAPAVAPIPAPAPEPPKEIEPVIPQLSNATVSAIASDHARQLSKCENGADLHGDVAVTFQIDASGKVTKSQLSSTIKNAKVASCILAAVRSWQFPRPPAGAAKGLYSINYQ